VIALSYGIKISAVDSFILLQSMPVNDRQTDMISIPKTALALLRCAVKHYCLIVLYKVGARPSVDLSDPVLRGLCNAWYMQIMFNVSQSTDQR